MSVWQWGRGALGMRPLPRSKFPVWAQTMFTKPCRDPSWRLRFHAVVKFTDSVGNHLIIQVYKRCVLSTLSSGTTTAAYFATIHRFHICFILLVKSMKWHHDKLAIFAFEEDQFPSKSMLHHGSIARQSTVRKLGNFFNFQTRRKIVFNIGWCFFPRQHE